MTSPFTSVALDLWERGYSPLPLEPCDKSIKIMGWQRYCTEKANRETLDMWLSWPDRNIGIALGQASGIIALDFDYDVNDKHKEILSIIGDSPVKKTGAKGFTAFYRYGGQRSVKYAISGQSVLEILSTGRQTVLPPSIHPGGMEYRWTTGKTLLDVSADELPELSAEQIAAIDKLFRSTEQITVARPVKSFAEMDANDISEALSRIPADDYHLWIRIGMALKDELGERGYALWDAWSATSTKYAGGKETSQKWRGFNGSGVHIETLFWNAIEMGYRPKPLPKEAMIYRPLQGGTMGDMAKDAPAPAIAVPGLPGLIMQHILASSVYPLPPLALAASIALSGAIMANKVQSESGLYTNFYCLGVADSAGGKDHARRVCRAILEKSGMLNKEIGIPKSGAGLLSGMRKSGNTGIMLLDEFGKYLKTISSGKASSHEAEITKILMELYTSAGSTFSGMEYADHDGKMPRQQIIHPCLSMYPVTTPDRFFEAMTSSDTLDGFIARFMVFQCEVYPVEPEEPQRRADDVPENILSIIQHWRMKNTGGTMGEAGEGEAQIIPEEPAAKALLKDYTSRMRYLWEQERRKGSGLHPIYGRLAEQAKKLALVAHDGDCIREPVAQWAIGIAEDCGARLAKIIKENVADNEQEKNVKYVLRVIKKLCETSENGYASLSAITHKTRQIKAFDRKSILNDLIISGAIDAFEDDREGRGMKSTLYKII